MARERPNLKKERSLDSQGLTKKLDGGRSLKNSIVFEIDADLKRIADAFLEFVWAVNRILTATRGARPCSP